MTDSSHKDAEASPGRRRRLWLVAAGTLIVIVAVAAVLPSLAASLAASAIREAVRPEFSESASVESSVSLGWSSPLAATIEVRDGVDVEASLAISTPRGLLGWIGPALGGSIGDLPLSFSLSARLEGEKGRELLDRLRREDDALANGEGPAESPPRSSGATSGMPEGLSIAATGSIDLAIVDAERGIDVAVRSDRLELGLLADRSLEVVAVVKVGRVGDGSGLRGRLGFEGAVSNAIAADGSISWAKALGAISIEASELDFDWEGRDVSIVSLRASAASDSANGISLAARAEGSINGELGAAEADLSWTSPFAEDGSLRRDFAGLGGIAKLSGFPSGVVAAMVPSPYAELLVDLGSSLRAEIAVPKEQDAALVATLEMEHLRGEASARLDRATGEIVEGRAEFSGAPSRLAVLAALGVAARDSGSGWSRLPLAASIEGLELLEAQDLRVAGAEVTLEPASSLLSDLLPQATLTDDRPLTLSVAAVRWRLGEGLPAIEARGVVEMGGAIAMEVADDRPPVEISAPRFEWFAEPLGKALSLRGRLGLSGGELRFEERFDGLWTGSSWIPTADLRPHGNLAIDSVPASQIAAWLPEAIREAWVAQDPGGLSLQVGTRVEGDRLEGSLQIAADGLSLEAPISLDSQRLAIGSTSIEATLRPEAIAALPESWRGEWRLLDGAPIAIQADPIVMAIASLDRTPFEIPPIAASLSAASIAVSGPASPDRLEARELRGSVRRTSAGAVDVEAALTLQPSTFALGRDPARSATTKRPVAMAAKVRRASPSDSPTGFDSLAFEMSPIDLEIRTADAAAVALLAAHRATIVPREGAEGFALRLAPTTSAEAGATAIRFDGAIAPAAPSAEADAAWAVDGEGLVQGLPAALVSAFVSDGGVVGKALGDALEATLAAKALTFDSGELAVAVAGSNGRLDLPRLLVEPEVLRIPVEPAFSGQFRFTPGLLASLEGLNPMLGQLESMEEPIRLRIWECEIPRAGVGFDRLDGNLRLDLGRGRFVPQGVLKGVLLAFGDANAAGFDGVADPLLTTIRGGRLSYDDFTVRFVPFRDGWRNTLRFSGQVDLTRTPAYGEFTAEYPAASLGTYSAEIRRLPPEVLESLTVPMTLYGPLDGSGLKTRIDFDFKKLLEAGVREGARRLFEDLLGPKK